MHIVNIYEIPRVAIDNLQDFIFSLFRRFLSCICCFGIVTRDNKAFLVFAKLRIAGLIKSTIPRLKLLAVAHRSTYCLLLSRWN